MDKTFFFEMYGNEIIVLSIMSCLAFLFSSSRKLLLPRAAETSTSLPPRIAFIDFAKGASILAVIIIHVCFLLLGSEASEAERSFLIFTNNLSRFAIAVFFICSATLLKPLSSYKSLAEFYLKKFLGVYLPYLMFSVAITSLSNENWLTTLKYILTGQASVPFYFVIVLIQFHILYPWLEKQKGKKWFLPSAFVVSFASFLVPQSWYFLGANLFFKFLFFFCYGLVIKEKILTNKLKTPKLSVLLFALTAYITLFTVFPSYLYNIRLIYGVLAFHALYFIFQKIKNSKPAGLFIKNGQNSLWLFLLHFSILELFYSLSFFKIDNFYLYFLALFTLAYLTSLLLTWPLSLVYKKFINYLLVPIKN